MLHTHTHTHTHKKKDRFVLRDQTQHLRLMCYGNINNKPFYLLFFLLLPNCGLGLSSVKHVIILIEKPVYSHTDEANLTRAFNLETRTSLKRE